MRQVTILAVENAEVRAEKLVGGTPQKIAIPGLHIDTLVGSKSEPHPQSSALPVHRIGDARDVDQSAGSIEAAVTATSRVLGPSRLNRCS